MGCALDLPTYPFMSVRMDRLLPILLYVLLICEVKSWPHGGISFYASTAVTAVRETLLRLSKGGLARRGAHRAPMRSSFGIGAPTSDQRHLAPAFRPHVLSRVCLVL